MCWLNVGIHLYILYTIYYIYIYLSHQFLSRWCCQEYDAVNIPQRRRRWNYEIRIIIIIAIGRRRRIIHIDTPPTPTRQWVLSQIVRLSLFHIIIILLDNQPRIIRPHRSVITTTRLVVDHPRKSFPTGTAGLESIVTHTTTTVDAAAVAAATHNHHHHHSTTFQTTKSWPSWYSV